MVVEDFNIQYIPRCYTDNKMNNKLRSQCVLFEQLCNAIQYGQELTPALLFDGCQTMAYGDTGYTPLMLWIEFRINEPIPEVLLYNNCKVIPDVDGNTPLHLWALYRPLDPNIPDCIWENELRLQTNNDGEIPLQMWIVGFCDIELNDGQHHWIHQSQIPERLLFPNWQRYTRGTNLTLAMYFAKNAILPQHPPYIPSALEYDEIANDKTLSGFTAYDYVFQRINNLRNNPRYFGYFTHHHSSIKQRAKCLQCGSRQKIIYFPCGKRDRHLHYNSLQGLCLDCLQEYISNYPKNIETIICPLCKHPFLSRNFQ